MSSPGSAAAPNVPELMTGLSRETPSWPSSFGGRRAYSAVALVVGAYAWWVAGLEHFTTSTLVAVVAAGALAVGAGWLRRRLGSPRAKTRVPLGSWPVLLGALLVWELLAFSLSPRSTHPTLSSIADAALRPRPIEALAFVAWLALGWRLASAPGGTVAASGSGSSSA